MSDNSLRIDQLLDNFHHLFNDKQDSGRQKQTECYKGLIREIYAKNTDKPVVIRKAEFLKAFADKIPVTMNERELIVGNHWFHHAILGDEENRVISRNMGHIIVDYGECLTQGITGIETKILGIQERNETIKINKAAFSHTLKAFSIFIRRYGEKALEIAKHCDNVMTKNDLRNIGENCSHISREAPVSFWQALQLVWFVQIFLHAESIASAVSFGRLDQYLWPFYSRDIMNGTLSQEFALELIKCFYIKTSEGDESQNLIVGGVNACGNNAENELSLLCLGAARELQVRQPSLSVRISSATSDAFWKEALELTAAGIGMPSYFNDAMVIKAIEATGIPLERARDYGIVGCYEANPQGDTHGLTVAGNFSLPELLLQYLQSCREDSSFESFYGGFKEFLQIEYIKRILPRFQERRDNIARNDPSPFQGICLTGCLETGLTAEEGGACYSLFGVNILGLGTTIDSLYVIHELIFTKRTVNMEYVREQLKADFEDHSFYLSCRSMPGKYGSDSEFTNKLTGDLSEYVALLVLKNKLKNDVRPYPGFFIFLADISEHVRATPDGRRNGERLSYGCGPTEYSPQKTPTSILNSAVNVRHDLCACGNPLTLSLGKNELASEEGLQILKQLIQAYFNGGGFHLHFNIVNAETLEEAQHNPEYHDALLVRISGLSAKFINLDKQIQDAIIVRTKLGQ